MVKKNESCLLILVQMVLMVTVLLAGIIWAIFFVQSKLNEYFNRGETIPVPDFRGKSLADVLQEKPTDLIIEKRDEKFDPQIPKDHVIAQYPEPGIRVKANKKILLTISLGNKQMSVPNLLDKNQREVSLSVLNAQLKEGNRAYITSLKFPRERVITQSPLPSSNQQIGGPVDLLISLGAGTPRAPLPNFVGRNITETRTALTSLGIKEGKILTKRDPSRPKDQIISTRPGPYDPITDGGNVDLLVSAGTENGNASTEDLRKFEALEAAFLAEKIPSPPSILTAHASGTTNASGTVAPPRILPPEEEEEEEEEEEDDLPEIAQVPAQEDTETPAGEASPNSPSGEQSLVSFVMPDGFMQKEVKFILFSPQGRQEVYSGVHKPLDLIKVKVRKQSESKVQIYINNIFIEERSL